MANLAQPVSLRAPRRRRGGAARLRSPSVIDEHTGRDELAALLRAAAHHGLHEGIDNHASLAIGGGRFLLNRFGPHWSEARSADLLVVDADGKVEGEGEAETTAFWLHSRVHRARPDATCVIHTHMPYATALCCTEGGLDTQLHQNTMRFHGRIAWLPEYGGRLVGADEGDACAEAVADGVRVVLLASHGVLVVGESIERVWYDLYFLERAAMVQVLAQSTGQPLRRVDDTIAAMTAKQFDEERMAHSPLLFAAERRRVG